MHAQTDEILTWRPNGHRTSGAHDFCHVFTWDWRVQKFVLLGSDNTFLSDLSLARESLPDLQPPTRNAISAGRSVGGEASRAVARRFPPLIEEVLAIPALKRSLRPSECIMASISSLPFTAMGQVAERRAPAGSGFRSSGFSAVSFSGFRGRVETSGPQMVVRCVAATGGEVVIV